MALIAWGIGPRSLLDACRGNTVHRITGHYRTKWLGSRHHLVYEAFFPGVLSPHP